MNERIKELLNRSGGEFYEGFLGSPNTIKFTEEELKTFAELIVRMCADAADMYEGNGYYVGDCVAEYMGYGQEEGVTEWRSK